MNRIDYHCPMIKSIQIQVITINQTKPKIHNFMKDVRTFHCKWNIIISFITAWFRKLVPVEGQTTEDSQKQIKLMDHQLSETKGTDDGSIQEKKHG